VGSQLLLAPASFAALPGWSEDEITEALPALNRSCRRLMRLPEDRPVGPAALAGTVADWRAPCQALADSPTGDSAALRQRLERWFQPFAVSDRGQAEGLFTGYYEAELSGSLTPGPGFATPLYRRPDDLLSFDVQDFRADLPPARLLGRAEGRQVVPYYSRAEIDGGALAGRGLELLWVSDPVDAFFLHVQGSGRVLLPDGSAVRVGFAASNGRAFTAIGRALVAEGRVDRANVSMQSIRDWLRAHPGEAVEVMQRNERYIFFRRIDGEGPIGAQGVALTPGRSLAVDPAFLPLGAPLWLDTTWPGGGGRPLRRLMVAQDSGSAIKGPVRGDFYWGSGDAALAEAGGMKQKGRYWLLLPKVVAERRAGES
jgi:membrane-bound lytic murein transglycosylase A